MELKSGLNRVRIRTQKNNNMIETVLGKFTTHYKKAMVRAYGLSLANKKKEIGMEELFWSLLGENGSLG